MAFKNDQRGQTQPQNKREAQQTGKPSPAGPHDRAKHRDEEKTPGAGTLPDPDEAEVNPGTG